MKEQGWLEDRKGPKANEEPSLGGVCLAFGSVGMIADIEIVVEINLRLSSMLHGKKGFDRIVYAFKNVLTTPVTWLFHDLGTKGILVFEWISCSYMLTWTKPPHRILLIYTSRPRGLSRLWSPSPSKLRCLCSSRH